jgi:hypothetical protein
MRSSTATLTLLLAVGCSSNPTTPPNDASADITYYKGGDGDVYAWNDAAPSCQPQSADGFVPVKITPVVNPVCTTSQVVGLVTQCFDPSLPDDTACNAWKADPANETCLTSCPVASPVAPMPVTSNPPPTPAGPWGPLVKILNPGELEFWNLGACVSVTDPSTAGQACADALNAELQCEYYTCAANCPVPTDTDAGATIIAAEEAYRSCSLAADTGPCASWVNAVTTCVSEPPDAAPESFCIDGTLLSGDPTSFDPAAEQFIGAQCGGAPESDAGTVADASDSG